MDLCPACSQPFDETADFCPHCGSPITSQATTDPVMVPIAQGQMVRSALKNPSLIGVIGVWLLFGSPFVITALLFLNPVSRMLVDAEEGMLGKLLGVLLILVFSFFLYFYFSVVYSVTARYLEARKQARAPAAEAEEAPAETLPTEVAPTYPWPTSVRIAQTAADRTQLLESARAVAYLAADTPAALKNQPIFATFAELLDLDHADLAVSCWVLPVESDDIEDWARTVELPLAAVHGGFGTVIWLDKGKLLAIEYSAAGPGSLGLIEQTLTLWPANTLTPGF